MSLFLNKPGGTDDHDKLKNLFNDTHPQYLVNSPSNNSRNTVVPTSSSTTALTVNGAASQTADIAKFASNGQNTVIDENARIGAGIVNPTARIHFAAQTTAANSAPIKLTDTWNLMTTPENGAFELANGIFYLTPSNSQRCVVNLVGINSLVLDNNYNDWNALPSYSTCLRLVPNAARTLTGLQGGFGGRLITIMNADSTNTITLSHNSTSSTYGNRFFFSTLADYALGPNKTVLFAYDSVNQVWRKVDT